MDRLFWISLALSGIIGFLASVAANIFNKRILNSVHKVGTNSRHRRIRKEMKRYSKLEWIKRHNSETLYIHRKGLLTLWVIMSGSFVYTFLLLLVILSDAPNGFYLDQGPFKWFIASMSLFSALANYASTTRMFKLLNDASDLIYFSRYRSRMRRLTGF